MAFRPGKKPVEFADLKGILAQTQIDNNLYQVLQVLIERLEDFRVGTQEELAGAGQAGTGLIPHAPTHYEGGSDPVDIKKLNGFPGGTTTFLRADKTFAAAGGGSGGMEYLGDFVAGPVYNDGDIVVAVDGIAYVCTKNGTTTPPEVWPGIGVVVNPIIDAKYWVSEPHANLTAEFNFGGIASGYVKSIVAAGVSNPTTIAVIPLSDGGTGGTDATTARTNLGLGTMAVQNANNVTITGGTFVGSSVFGTSVTANAMFANTTIQAGTGFFGDGANITNLNASSLATGIAAPARLGTGIPDATKFLRGDGVWATIASIGATVPSGLIAMFDTACPAGWTRFASLDNRFPIGSATFGILVGSEFHAHGNFTGVAGAHGHNFSFSGNTGNFDPPFFTYDDGGSNRRAASIHSHPFTVSGPTDAVPDHAHSIAVDSNIPPAISMIYCKKD